MKSLSELVEDEPCCMECTIALIEKVIEMVEEMLPSIEAAGAVRGYNFAIEQVAKALKKELSLIKKG